MTVLVTFFLLDTLSEPHNLMEDTIIWLMLSLHVQLAQRLKRHGRRKGLAVGGELLTSWWTGSTVRREELRWEMCLPGQALVTASSLQTPLLPTAHSEPSFYVNESTDGETVCDPITLKISTSEHRSLFRDSRSNDSSLHSLIFSLFLIDIILTFQYVTQNCLLLFYWRL